MAARLIKVAQNIIAAIVRLFRWWFRQIAQQQSIRGKAVVTSLGLFVLCIACAAPAASVNDPSKTAPAAAVSSTRPTSVEAEAPTERPTMLTATETPVPTSTPTAEPPESPTATSEPTAIPTAAPTATAQPTAAPTAKPKPTAKPAAQQNLAGRAGCDPSYPDVCIPPAPPDLDCKDIPYRRFKVLAPDPHRFDGKDQDGIGCES